MDKIRLFKVFSNDIRLKIFEFLLEGPMCVSVIVNKLNVSQPTVTQHLKELQHIGLVKAKKIGFWMHYSIDKTGLSKAKRELEEFAKSLKIENTECKFNHDLCPEIKKRSGRKLR